MTEGVVLPFPLAMRNHINTVLHGTGTSLSPRFPEGSTPDFFPAPFEKGKYKPEKNGENGKLDKKQKKGQLLSKDNYPAKQQDKEPEFPFFPDSASCLNNDLEYEPQ